MHTRSHRGLIFRERSTFVDVSWFILLWCAVTDQMDPYGTDNNLINDMYDVGSQAQVIAAVFPSFLFLFCFWEK